MKLSLKNHIAPALIILVLLLNLTLGLSRIGKYSAVDEPYWTYGRISKFWTAIEQHKWRSTNINDKPGITVAILSGFGLLSFDPMAYQALRGGIKTSSELADMDAINFFFRLPIFLFCILLLPLFYVFLRKLFDEATALIAFLLIALSPILLGISMIINPDALLWIFLPLALITSLIFQENEDRRYLILSGIFIGLSLLTKYVSNILYIFLFFLPFLNYILLEKKPVLRTYFQKSLTHYLILVAISMATFYVLYPATWAHPNTLLKGTFLSKVFETTWPMFATLIALMLIDFLLLKNKVSEFLLTQVSRFRKLLIRGVVGLFLLAILITVLDTFLGMKPFDFESILASPKGIGDGTVIQKYTGAILADFYALLFGISPIAFFGLIGGLILSLRRTSIPQKEMKTLFFFALFILLYYLGSSVNDVAATVRYQIALYPLVLIMSAIGLSAFFTSLTPLLERRFSISRRSLTVLATTLLLITLLSGVFFVRPFYFAYASFLLPQQYLLNTKDMGDGSFEAAAYLNTLPQARDLSIWSDKGAVCAEFIGTCTIGFSKKDLTGKHFDYYVISMGRLNRSLKLSGGVNDIVNFKQIYAPDQPFEKNITIGGRPQNFVRVISASSIR